MRASRAIAFAIALRIAREMNGLTKSAMARRLGVAPPTITKIESGRGSVRESTVHRYAEALGMVAVLELKWPKT